MVAIWTLDGLDLITRPLAIATEVCDDADMPAYVIARVNVSDQDQYDKYKVLTPDAIASSGGKFLVRGGDHEVLEGEQDDRRIVVLEFESTQAAKAFYDSPAYVEARHVRAGAATMEMVVVEGI